jgi:hypothetical protein
MRLTTSMRAARAGWPRHARTTVYSHRSAPYTPPPPDAAGNPRHSVITAKQRCGSTAVPLNWFGWRVMPCRASPGSSPHSIPAVSASPDRRTTNSSASPAIRPTYKAGSRRHSYCRAGTIRFNTSKPNSDRRIHEMNTHICGRRDHRRSCPGPGQHGQCRRGQLVVRPSGPFGHCGGAEHQG